MPATAAAAAVTVPPGAPLSGMAVTLCSHRLGRNSTSPGERSATSGGGQRANLQERAGERHVGNGCAARWFASPKGG